MLSFNIIIIFLAVLPISVFSCAATSAVSSPVLTPPVCTTCGNANVVTRAGTGEVNPPIVQTSGTNAAGCQTITVTCTNPGGTQAFFFFEENGVDRGIATDGTATVSRTLTCNANGDLVLVEPDGIVTTVECLAAA